MFGFQILDLKDHFSALLSQIGLVSQSKRLTVMCVIVDEDLSHLYKIMPLNVKSNKSADRRDATAALNAQFFQICLLLVFLILVGVELPLCL